MCNNCCKTKCTVVLLATTASAQITLPESNRIRNGRVLAISMRRLNGVAAKANNGATLAVDTVTISAHLSLKNANGTEVWQMPLQYLQRDFNAPEPLRCDIRNIDPTQSTITLDTGATGYSATAVFEFLFELECDDCGIPANLTK